MKREHLLSNVRSLLHARDSHGLHALARSTSSSVLADVMALLSPEHSAALLRLLPPGPGAEIFSHLDSEQQDAVLEAMPRAELVRLFEHLPSDDRADIYNRMDESRRTQLLPALAKIERDDILNLAAYREGTVGSVMTSDYAAVRADLTVAQALQTVRQEAPDKETIYQIYIVDDARRLSGIVSLRDLVLAPEDARVADLMRTDVVSARADWPREQAARLISDHDLLAIPVVDADDRLLGIVTVDDAMDVAEEESTEDFHKGGGTLALKNLSVKDASAWLLYRKRVFWLAVLVFGNLLSGAGIAYFEDTIAAYIALVFFLPLLIDSGGNAGSQSATLMVRALATGDVVIKDWVKMLGREFGVAGLLGVTMAVAVSGIGLFRGGPDIALVVSLSMVVIVIVGSVVGMSLPFLLSRLKLDPATASAPLITSVADAAGVMIYLSIAVAVLGAPPIGG
jgi:magnesium transporter